MPGLFLWVSSQKVGANLGVRPWGRHPGLPLPRIIEKILLWNYRDYVDRAKAHSLDNAVR